MSAFTDAYVDLLIKQYWEKPKARAEIELLAGSLEPVRDMYRDIPAAFDIDQAVGVQLDVLGKIVGLNRLLPFVLQRIAFGFWERDILIAALTGTLAVTNGGPLTFARATAGTYWDADTDQLTEAAIDAARFESVGGTKRLLVEEARTNKFTGYNANPDAGLTSIALAGTSDPATTIARVTDAAALAAAGLDGVCTAGNVLKIDNSAGVADGIVDLSPATGNTNPHSLTAYIRSTGGGGAIRLSGSAGVSFTATASYTRTDAENQTPATAADTMQIVVDPGTIVYAILYQIEEAPTSSAIIVTAGASAARSADIAYLPNADIPDLTGSAIFSVRAAIPNDGVARCLFSSIDGAGDTYLQRGTTGVLEGAFGGVPFTSTYTPDEAEHRYIMETEGDEIVIKQDDTDVHTFIAGAPVQPTADFYIGSYNGASAFLNDRIGDMRIGDTLGNAYSKGFDDKFVDIADVAPFADRFEPTRTDLELSDSDYRLFLKVKIARNVGSPYMVTDEFLSIQDAVRIAFGGLAYVVDNKDMTLDLYVDPTYDIDRLVAIVRLNLLPKPQGVRYKVIVQAILDGTFGFSDNTNSQPFANKFDLATEPGGRFANKVVF